MIKLLGATLFTAGLVGFLILYLRSSSKESKKNLLKFVSFVALCLVVTALLLTTIVILF